jgi:hypothetical protein
MNTFAEYFVIESEMIEEGKLPNDLRWQGNIMAGS